MVAEQQSVHSRNREHLVHVCAKVEPDLADAVRQLADDGNPSLSREIRAAIAEHVKESSTTAAAPLYGCPVGGVC